MIIWKQKKKIIDKFAKSTKKLIPWLGVVLETKFRLIRFTFNKCLVYYNLKKIIIIIIITTTIKQSIEYRYKKKNNN